MAVIFNNGELPPFDINDFELKEKLEGLKDKWLFELDTKESREVMRREFTDVILDHVVRKRNEKINSILNDKS